MSILKREVFYTIENGKVKFLDWARTTVSGLGVCAEPFFINERRVPGVSIPDFDPSEEMSRVDALVLVDGEDGLKRALFNEPGVPIHGGNLQPRVFAKAGNF